MASLGVIAVVLAGSVTISLLRPIKKERMSSHVAELSEGPAPAEGPDAEQMGKKLEKRANS
jgi:hypothetical protein